MGDKLVREQKRDHSASFEYQETRLQAIPIPYSQYLSRPIFEKSEYSVRKCWILYICQVVEGLQR